MNTSTNSNARTSLYLQLGLVVIVVVFVVIAVVQGRSATSSTPAPTAEVSAPTVRADTRMLSEAPEGEVTVVEFLDFECESCAAAYPVVEQLREVYGDRVDFAIRYFPLPGHVNSENAAISVEAAAQQGQLNEMYSLMYETQAQWGESTESKAAIFRGYAEQLGLDMAEYDRTVADSATLERVRSDFTDGRALGVNSTPTFFVDDAYVELTSFEDLERAITEALEG